MGCRSVRPADEMVRLSVHQGRPTTDRHAGGRGAWLCPTVECFSTARRRRALDRALRQPIDPARLDELGIAFPPPGGS